MEPAWSGAGGPSRHLTTVGPAVSRGHGPLAAAESGGREDALGERLELLAERLREPGDGGDLAARRPASPGASRAPSSGTRRRGRYVRRARADRGGGSRPGPRGGPTQPRPSSFRTPEVPLPISIEVFTESGHDRLRPGRHDHRQLLLGPAVEEGVHEEPDGALVRGVGRPGERARASCVKARGHRGK
jgi:hypothetical protein